MAGGTMTRQVLELRDISKIFASSGGLRALIGGGGRQVSALKDLSLGLGAGEILGVVGESGSGKSTLGNIILGLEQPTTGTMLVDGKAGQGLKRGDRLAFRRRVQMIFQDPSGSLNPRFTIGRTVEEPLVIHGLGDAAERRRRMLAALEEAELKPAEHFAERFPHELSGGQRQRVAIARAVILRPSILIADEPVSMLDVSVRAGILRLLRRLVSDHDMSLIFITHDLSLIGTMCDRVIIMYRGCVVESGEAKAVMRAPRHPYTRQLIDAVPVPDPDWQPPPLTLKPGSEETPEAGCRFAPRCDLAFAPCRASMPALVSDPTGHAVACFHAESAGPIGRAQPTTDRMDLQR